MTENTKTIKEICEQYGMGQTALARRFGIPLRTVQDWHAGRTKPPVYVVGMIDELLQIEAARTIVDRETWEAVQAKLKEKTDRSAPPLGYKWEGDKLVIDEPTAAKIREALEQNRGRGTVETTEE